MSPPANEPKPDPIYTDEDLEAIRKHLLPAKHRRTPASLLEPLNDNYLRRELEFYAAPLLGLGPKEYGKKAEQTQTDLRKGLKDISNTMTRLLKKVDGYLVDYVFGDSLAVDGLMRPVKVHNALVCLREDAKVVLEETHELLEKLPMVRPSGPENPDLRTFYRSCLKLFDQYNPSSPAKDVIRRESDREAQGKPPRNRVVLSVKACLGPVNRRLGHKPGYGLESSPHALNKTLRDMLNENPPKS